MPPLGGTGPRRTSARAYRKRQANLKRIPKAKPAYRPPAPVSERARAPRPAPTPRPTPAQLHASRVAAQGYKSQAGAVRRAAKTQKTLGPGKAVRPGKGGRVLHQADVKRAQAVEGTKAVERGYAYTPKVTSTNVMPVPKQLEKAKAKGLLETDPKKLKAAGFRPPGALEKAVSSPKYGIKAIASLPRDAKDVSIGIPTSIVHTVVVQGGGVRKAIAEGSVKPIIEAEKQTAKEVIEPYKQLYKDPVKFASERPLTTFLMLRGGPAAIGRGAGAGARAVARVPAVGKAVRATGLHTLERPAATLPGTTLKQVRPGSRDLRKRVKELRQDKKNPEPTIGMTRRALPGRESTQLEKSVDMAFDANEQHRARAQASAHRKKHAELKQQGVKRDERKEIAQEHVRLAGEGARQEGRRRIGRQFGSHWGVHKGHVYKPTDAPEMGGKLHTSRADAEKVLEALQKDKNITWKPAIMHVEHVEGQPDAWAVVPEQVKQRFERHEVVGTSPAVGAVNRRQLFKAFRTTVLPYSKRWLAGQAGEAAYRGAVQGAGPLDYVRARRVLKRMPKKDREELLGRTVQPAQFGITGPHPEFVRGEGRTLHEAYEKTPEAQVYATRATKIHRGLKKYVPPYAAANLLHKHFSKAVFDINAKIEQGAKTAMLGHELKKGPLMDHRLVAISGKAMQDAADGLRNTSAQDAMAHQLQRAYGKYSAHSPAWREYIAHTTPFIPWFKNMVEFNISVMPKDHPIKSSLLASYHQADEDWRRRQNLTYHDTKDKKHVPDWLMGSYPVKGGGRVPVGKFGPFVPGEYAGAVAGQFSPVMQTLAMNLAGVDWKGTEIKNASQERLIGIGALGAGTALVPGVGPATAVTGLGEKYVYGKKGAKAVTGKDRQKIDQATLDWLKRSYVIKPGKGKKPKKKSGPALGGRGKLGGNLGGPGVLR
jgi:hypothetical protein